MTYLRKSVSTRRESDLFSCAVRIDTARGMSIAPSMTIRPALRPRESTAKTMGSPSSVLTRDTHTPLSKGSESTYREASTVSMIGVEYWADAAFSQEQPT